MRGGGANRSTRTASGPRKDARLTSAARPPPARAAPIPAKAKDATKRTATGGPAHSFRPLLPT